MSGMPKPSNQGMNTRPRRRRERRPAHPGATSPNRGCVLDFVRHLFHGVPDVKSPFAPHGLAHEEKVPLSPLFAVAAECPQQPLHVLPRMLGSDEDEIGLSPGQPRCGCAAPPAPCPARAHRGTPRRLRCRPRRCGRDRCRIARRCHRRCIGSPWPAGPQPVRPRETSSGSAGRHPGREPLRVVFEIEIVLDGHLRHGGAPAQKSIGRHEQVRPDSPQHPGNAMVHPPIDQEWPARRRPHPMQGHVVPGKQLLWRIAVKEEVEFVFRVVGHNALHGLEGEPTDAVKRPGITRRVLMAMMAMAAKLHPTPLKESRPHTATPGGGRSRPILVHLARRFTRQPTRP